MNRMQICIIAVTTSIVMTSAVFAESNTGRKWLDMDLRFADGDAPEKKDEQPAPCEGPPLPFHCIEGYSGGAITPLAYICNPGCKYGKCGVPVVAVSAFNAGSKELYALTITQTFFERIEIGFAYNRFDIGSVYDDIKKLGLNTGSSHVDLFHFNLRGLLVKEDSYDLPLPAVTAGVHFKYNADVDDMNHHLRVPGMAPRGAFTLLGYDSDCGVDFTLTMSKTLIEPLFNRPLIITGGLRFTKAAQLGFLGFGKSYHMFFEGSVCYMPFDNIVLGYEIRMKESPYNTFRNPANGKIIVGEEDPWQALSVSWLVNNNLTISGLYGIMGTMVNSTEDRVVGFQVKYEF